LRKKGAEAQVVSFYLMTSPHANKLGLYYLPILYIADETGLGLEGASKGLRSQDQEQDQEQEQDKDLSGHGSATPPDGGSSDEAPSEKPKSSYPEEFE
ncbi:DNA-binding protein, partial [Klebsiella pneumoniae]|nr:DNA-binding protein [Klebsiella pneumoniae]